jgi:hypothetical protein
MKTLVVVPRFTSKIGRRLGTDLEIALTRADADTIVSALTTLAHGSPQMNETILSLQAELKRPSFLGADYAAVRITRKVRFKGRGRFEVLDCDSAKVLAIMGALRVSGQSRLLATLLWQLVLSGIKIHTQPDGSRVVISCYRDSITLQGGQVQ